MLKSSVHQLSDWVIYLACIAIAMSILISKHDLMCVYTVQHTALSVPVEIVTAIVCAWPSKVSVGRQQ